MPQLQSPSNDSTRPVYPWPVWWHDPARRQNAITAMERHNEALFLEAVSFLTMWKSEIAADALVVESAA